MAYICQYCFFLHPAPAAALAGTQTSHCAVNPALLQLKSHTHTKYPHTSTRIMTKLAVIKLCASGQYYTISCLPNSTDQRSKLSLVLEHYLIMTQTIKAILLGAGLWCHVTCTKQGSRNKSGVGTIVFAVFVYM